MSFFGKGILTKFVVMIAKMFEVKDSIHTGRNCFNLFQISFSANTMDTDLGVSRVSKDQKNCEKY